MRLLLRSRGYTAASVLTLALGLGVNIAIFMLAKTVSNEKRIVSVLLAYFSHTL
jgi:ABC-type Na+ efflux pump permease subunit